MKQRKAAKRLALRRKEYERTINELSKSPTFKEGAWRKPGSLNK